MNREITALERLDTLDTYYWQERCRNWRNDPTYGEAVYNIFMYVCAAGNERITVEQLEYYIGQLPSMFLKKAFKDLAPVFISRRELYKITKENGSFWGYLLAKEQYPDFPEMEEVRIELFSTSEKEFNSVKHVVFFVEQFTQDYSNPDFLLFAEDSVYDTALKLADDKSRPARRAIIHAYRLRNKNTLDNILNNSTEASL